MIRVPGGEYELISGVVYVRQSSEDANEHVKPAPFASKNPITTCERALCLTAGP